MSHDYTKSFWWGQASLRRSVRFGPLQVMGPWRVRRGKTLRLKTDFQDFEVYVSDTGRSLRVWDHKTGRELK